MARLQRNAEGKYTGLIMLSTGEAGSADTLGIKVRIIRSNPYVVEPDEKKAGQIVELIAKRRREFNKKLTNTKKSVKRRL